MTTNSGKGETTRNCGLSCAHLCISSMTELWEVWRPIPYSPWAFSPHFPLQSLILSVALCYKDCELFLSNSTTENFRLLPVPLPLLSASVNDVIGFLKFSFSLRCFHQYQHTMVRSVTGTVVTTHNHHKPVTSNEVMPGVDSKIPALSTLYTIVSRHSTIW